MTTLQTEETVLTDRSVKNQEQSDQNEIELKEKNQELGSSRRQSKRTQAQDGTMKKCKEFIGELFNNKREEFLRIRVEPNDTIDIGERSKTKILKDQEILNKIGDYISISNQGKPDQQICYQKEKNAYHSGMQYAPGLGDKCYFILKNQKTLKLIEPPNYQENSNEYLHDIEIQVFKILDKKNHVLIGDKNGLKIFKININDKNMLSQQAEIKLSQEDNDVGQIYATEDQNRIYVITKPNAYKEDSKSIVYQIDWNQISGDQKSQDSQVNDGPIEIDDLIKHDNYGEILTFQLIKEKDGEPEVIYLAGLNGGLTKLDLNMKVLMQIEPQDENKLAVDNVTYDRINQLLYCCEYGEKYIRIYDQKNHKQRRIECGNQHEIKMFKNQEEGNNYLIMGGNKHLQILDTETEQIIADYQVYGQVNDIYQFKDYVNIDKDGSTLKNTF